MSALFVSSAIVRVPRTSVSRGPWWSTIATSVAASIAPAMLLSGMRHARLATSRHRPGYQLPEEREEKHDAIHHLATPQTSARSAAVGTANFHDLADRAADLCPGRPLSLTKRRAGGSTIKLPASRVIPDDQ